MILFPGLVLLWRLMPAIAVKINIGILLPAVDVPPSQEACFSISHVRPGVDLAFDHISSSSLKISNFTFRAQYVDSHCSDTYGPVAAMDMFYRGDIHAFFGPCCKYALSPVARYSKVWGLPVLTPGGLTSAFSNKAEFPLLTRIVAPYDKAVPFLLKILAQFSWTHTSLLWHNNIFQPALGASEWHQVIETIIRQMRLNDDMFPEPYKDYFDQSQPEAFDWQRILEGISNNSRGKPLDDLWPHFYLLKCYMLFMYPCTSFGSQGKVFRFLLSWYSIM